MNLHEIRQILTMSLGGYFVDDTGEGYVETQEALLRIERAHHTRGQSGVIVSTLFDDCLDALRFMIETASNSDVMDMNRWLSGDDSGDAKKARVLFSRILELLQEPSRNEPREEFHRPESTGSAVEMNYSLENHPDWNKRVGFRDEIEWVQIPEGEFLAGLQSEHKERLTENIRTRLSFKKLARNIQEQYQLIQSKIQSVGLRDDLRVLTMLDPSEPRFQYAQLSDEERRFMLNHNYLSAIFYCEYLLWTIGTSERVYLPSFYISKYPITDHQCRQITGIGPVGVADNFCPKGFAHREEAERVAAMLGARLALPLEWEKAARGTDGRLYTWGNEWDPSNGSFGGSPLNCVHNASPCNAFPAGQSPYGVMDMLGNLREFSAQSGIAMGFNALLTKRLPENLRGFPWLIHLIGRRASDRFIDKPTDTLGLRLVVDEL